MVVPLIESICRNEGSKLGAVELLVGETREHFQDEATQQFETRLKETGVDLQYGLVRHIYIPKEVRLPIQQKYLADELTLTREQEQLTAKIEADLREQERTVELEAERIKVETEKLVAEKQAEGKKQAAETRAQTTKQVAAIDRQTAELEREAIVLRGAAEADSQQQMEQAKASRFELAVKAFGDPAAFNQWVFATGLPDEPTGSRTADNAAARPRNAAEKGRSGRGFWGEVSGNKIPTFPQPPADVLRGSPSSTPPPRRPAGVSPHRTLVRSTPTLNRLTLYRNCNECT